MIPQEIDKLQGLVAELVGVIVEPDQPLMEAGLDSIGSMELRNLVRIAMLLSSAPLTNK